MRVVSWNIELAERLGIAENELTKLGELKDADVILLQEMDPSGTQKLADSLGMSSVYGAPATHPKTGKPFGNAVLSRWPMRGRVELLLPGTARVQGQPRSVVGTTVDFAGTHVQVYSVHLETVLLSLRQRVVQARTAAAHIASSAPNPVVLGGDFNSASARSMSAFDAVLASAGLDRATNADATFHRFRRGYRLDHIYTRGATATESGVAGRATASDHSPIWAHIEVGRGRPAKSEEG